MSQGTLYIFPQSPRGSFPAALAKYFNLDVQVKYISECGEEFAAKFPLKKIPAFAGKNGFKLTEVIAISYYCMFLPSFF
ncbi:uncharacterized protein SCODWIG_02598 [Saccharomycodes ludwigii]|uniref:GST N-terminal domain-containing protein n=1 Tax=Saccharomycodes ludwigii TaxID=36035 RepID=A0A376B813_9ASCO|nr:uncharacterized protein SCODWIG_02598 [Saccharomycodes ludwigii]